MKRSHRFPLHKIQLVVVGCVLSLTLTGCLRMFAPEAEPLEPTRTPIPTFTPTVEGAAPVSIATEAPAVEEPTAAAPAVEEPAVDAAPPTDTPPPAEPTATPTPEPATAVVSQGMNVRGGPGTNYQIIGAAQAGDSFAIKGKDTSGAWWQVDYNGRDGWLFGQLTSASNADGVAVAQNIPAPPPPTNTPVPPPPTNTPVPQQAAPTQPPAPANNYKFNVAVVGKCERQPAGNWFEGKTYVNGQPASGYKVVFSYAPDGPHVTPAVTTGPHPGYEGWDAGYYSHIINASGPQSGNWFVWVVDDGGSRISEIANWQSTGPGDGCNQAVVDFDSR